MIPRKGSADGFLRDVGQVLRASDIGIRWGDNVGPTVTMTYSTPRAPFTLTVPATSTPLGVFVLRAKNKGNNEVESGCRVTWRHGHGTLVVTEIDVSNPAAEYDVTLGFLMG